MAVRHLALALSALALVFATERRAPGSTTGAQRTTLVWAGRVRRRRGHAARSGALVVRRRARTGATRSSSTTPRGPRTSRSTARATWRSPRGRRAGWARTTPRARIKTRGHFEQAGGRFEARMRMPSGQGMWPAFWLLGSNFATAGWPACGEIDIMEYRGQEPTIAARQPARTRATRAAARSRARHTVPGAPMDSAFHVYAVEWTVEQDHVVGRRHRLLHGDAHATCPRARSGCSTIRSSSSWTSPWAAASSGPPNGATTFPAAAARGLRARVPGWLVSRAARSRRWRSALALLALRCAAGAAAGLRAAARGAARAACWWSRRSSRRRGCATSIRSPPPPRRAGPRWRASTSRCSCSTACSGEMVPWLATARRVARGEPRAARHDARRRAVVRRPAVLGARRGVHVRPAQALPGARPPRRVGLPRRRERRWTRTPWTSASSACSSPAPTRSSAQQIVPEHVWARDQGSRSTFANEHPVATGPFTEVLRVPEPGLRAGPQPALLAARAGRSVEALRFPAFPGNDRANLALVFDEVDWAGNFVPAIDRVFVKRSPADARATGSRSPGSTVFLYANTRRAPFDDVRVRKALSMAIDRELLVDVALYRYSHPSDATGLSDAYSTWRDSTAVARRRLGAPRPAARGRAARRSRLPARRDGVAAPAGRLAVDVRDPHRFGLVGLGARRAGDRARAARAGHRRHGAHLRLQRLVPARAGGQLRPFARLVVRGTHAVHVLPLAHGLIRRSSRWAPRRWATGTASEAPRPTARWPRSSARPIRRPAPPVRRDAARVRGPGARDPALSRTLVGRVQPRTLRRLSLARPTPTPTPRPTSSTAASACSCSPRSRRTERHGEVPGSAARLLPRRGVGRA